MRLYAIQEWYHKIQEVTPLGFTHPMNREAMTEACVEVLRCLGKLALAVDAFRVTFSQNKSGDWEAGITVHFSDPMGTQCSHATSYEFKTSEWPPNYRVIAMGICKDDFLERAIQAHIERGRVKHKRAAQDFLELD